MVEEFAIDRLLGLDMYGIPLRPWYLAGHACHAAGVDDVISGCCAWEVCPPSPAAHPHGEFAAALSWSEVAEAVEVYQHEHESAEPLEPVEPPPRHDFGIPEPPEPPDLDDDGPDGPDDD